MDMTAMPKAELHCHVDGLVNVRMLQAQQEHGHSLAVTVEALQAACPVRTLDEFFRWYIVTDPLRGDFGNFEWILAHHLERLKAQNVVYAEIMLGTTVLPRGESQLIDQLSALREHVTALESGEIQIEFLLSSTRATAPEQFEAIANRVMRLHKADLLVGVALAGWPEVSIRPLHRTLARLRDAGVGIEIHAGEWAGPELVWDALDYGPPDRIGHGCSLFQDPRLLERIQREQIHIEMCPISNLKTGTVARIEDHPIRLARDLGLNFSVNTDDPGPFEDSMESEYALLMETFGFQPSDFERIYANTLAARFQAKLRHRRTS